MSYTFDPRFLQLKEMYPSHKLRMTPAQKETLDSLITFIWPAQDHRVIKTQFQELITAAQKRFPEKTFTQKAGWSEQQMVLICYGDHIRSEQSKKTPLQALKEFCQHQFHEEEFSQLTIHLLPIYTSPYKDGGFDITDPFAVNPAMGTWDDVQSLGQQFNVAVDFVANHLSISSEWFKRYMADDPLFQNFFIGFDDEMTVRNMEEEALPKIYRPRPHNPFIPVEKPDGSIRWVYMTFSDHQADVNYGHPFVFLKMTEVLLFYILHGAKMIRLDAIPYLWKEWGTACAHHPSAHALVELSRLACDLVNPMVKLLAESMEPLADSKRYLSTTEESKAHLAYNFVPCGLIPHTLVTEDATVFQRNLLNFLPPGKEVNWAVVCGVTHDGSSINPCRAPQSAAGEAILNEEQINAVAKHYTEHGYQEIKGRSELPVEHPQQIPEDFFHCFSAKHGEEPRFVNYKTVSDEQGQPRQIVYEAITTYASLFDQNPDKIVAALGMALTLPGIPFIYLTSPFAVLNDFGYYQETGNPRELNRGRVWLEELLQDLSEKETLTYKVFTAYKKLLRLRASYPAFHPNGELIPVSANDSAIITFLRVSIDQKQHVLIVQNVSSMDKQVELTLPKDTPTPISAGLDLMSGQSLPVVDYVMHLQLQPFMIKWFELQLL